jgi:hypothetical protein
MKKLFLHKFFPAFLFFAATPAWAATVWNGPVLLFTQPGSDPTQAANQDRLTAKVWLTRASTAGLFNAKTESAYTHFSSPSDTQWAYGELANYSSLPYKDWEDWFGGSAAGGPSVMLGKDAVVHLVSDDIYLSIRFESFARGGGFSYDRSTPGPVPEPSISLLLLTALPLAVVLHLIARPPALSPSDGDLSHLESCERNLLLAKAR